MSVLPQPEVLGDGVEVYSLSKVYKHNHVDYCFPMPVDGSMQIIADHELREQFLHVRYPSSTFAESLIRVKSLNELSRLVSRGSQTIQDTSVYTFQMDRVVSKLNLPEPLYLDNDV